MNIKEFNNVKHYNYLDYCDYLQTKYGLGPVSYMTKNWNKNPKASRTAEGLVAHHKMEDTAIMLGTIIRISVHMNLTKNVHYPCLCA